MSESDKAQDPKLVAVETQLASDRGEVYDPASDSYHLVHTLRKERDVDSIISAAVVKAKKGPQPQSVLDRKISFDWAKRLLTFGLWKPATEAKRDYTYEFDPKTGGERRVYIVRDSHRPTRRT